MTKMKVGPDLEQLITWAYRAKRAVLLVGSTGVGKSEILKAAARHLGIECIIRDLSLLEAPDLVGIPMVKNGVTVYAPPNFLPKSGSSGILIFDELNRAPSYVLNPCLQLLTERCLNDYCLPDSWICVAAINPPVAIDPSDDDGYIVNDLDKALISRFIEVHVEADVRLWLDWARKANVHHSVIEYVASTPKVFNNEKSNPRAWTYVSSLLLANEQEFCDEKKSVLLAALTGIVGDTHALTFLKFMSQDSDEALPSVEAIISHYKTVRGKINEWVKAGNTAILDSLCNSLLVHVQDPQTKNDISANVRKLKNMEKFIGDLPAELKTKVQKRCAWAIIK